MTTFMQPSSCDACRLCNINGQLHCSECAEQKRLAEATRVEASVPAACSMCGLPEGICPCDRRDLFTMGDDDSLTIEGEQFCINVRILSSSYTA